MDAKRTIRVLGALACVGFGLAAVQLAGVRGAAREARVLRTSLAGAHEKLESLPTGAQLSQLRDVAAALPGVEADGPDRGGVHAWLSAALGEAGLRSQSITTLEPSVSGGVTVRAMSVECVGGFRSVLAFVHALDVSNKPIRLSRLQLQRAAAGTADELMVRMDLSATEVGGAHENR